MAEERFVPPPHEDYSLNAFLARLAQSVSEDEVIRLKATLRDRGGGVMERLHSATDVFNLLQTEGTLTRNNLVILQAIIWNLRRPDLYKEIVDYCQGSSRQPLHTFAPRQFPENGYKYVKFHLRGINDINGDTLESLRANVAAWLCVPPEFVVIAGLEPTNSWEITFMVPEICAEVLVRFAESHQNLLLNYDIDSFVFDGKRTNLVCNDEPIQGKLDLVVENERLQKCITDLSEQMEHLRTNAMELRHENTLFQKQTQEIKLEKQMFPFSAFGEFLKLKYEIPVLAAGSVIEIGAFGNQDAKQIAEGLPPELRTLLGEISHDLQMSDKDTILLDPESPLEDKEKAMLSSEEYMFLWESGSILEFVLAKAILTLERKAIEARKFPENVAESILRRTDRVDLADRIDRWKTGRKGVHNI